MLLKLSFITDNVWMKMDTVALLLLITPKVETLVFIGFYVFLLRQQIEATKEI